MFQNITLELSLKPFKKIDDDSIRAVCAGIFEQWNALIKNREIVSVMLWVGDGSEILDYDGDLDKPMEWCHYIGSANQPYQDADTPLETSLHERKRDYMKEPVQMTYATLKKIIACLKAEGKKRYPHATIRVGETFDIGPEFAVSEFKYKRHPEICVGYAQNNGKIMQATKESVEEDAKSSAQKGYTHDRMGFVDATSLLHGDTHHYAAYPDGIPEGTPFGTFFGKQTKRFFADLDIDFLWLSNGLGFSANPWEKTGKIFDGTQYYPEKLKDTKAKVFAFWSLFRKECPDITLETRGTNNSVGIDYASDGVPLYDLYTSELNITPPPNSPWAALNDNYGLELMGHMSRICELPGERFPFRYYLHDPWWVNSPWYDRYDGSPCDIYLPMAISRINAEGKVESANSLNILSIDNSYGGMPDCCVNEPLPHILKAEKDTADSPAPLIWIYPMREYTTSEGAELLREMNLGDHYICDAINDGLPLSGVVSTNNFLKHSAETYRRSILISPVPENCAVTEQLKAFAAQGIGVLMYGTREKLETVVPFENLTKLDVSESAGLLRKALEKYGYSIRFSKKQAGTKPPTMMFARRDNGLFLSVYNCNTTTGTLLKFPFGAPILCGMESEILDGHSCYHFSRAEHRECRIYVEQQSGIISCREAPPVNARYRRAIRIRGLENATVRLFSEIGCECAVNYRTETDSKPKFDTRFKKVHDELYGDYMEGENISGDILFLIGHRGTV